MVQNPAAAFRSSRFGANSSVRQKRSALSNPTKITRLTFWGLGTRLCGFHTRSFSNSRAVPELAASWVKKDQVVWRYFLGLLDINIPSRLSSWTRTPRSAVGVRTFKRIEMVGSLHWLPRRPRALGLHSQALLTEAEGVMPSFVPHQTRHSHGFTSVRTSPSSLSTRVFLQMILAILLASSEATSNDAALAWRCHSKKGFSS